MTIHSSNTEAEYSPVLSIENLSVKFSDTFVLKDLSLQLFPGEITCIIGLSGSGKSTLFRSISGLLQTQEGQINVFSQAPSSAQHLMSYMMQDDLLLSWRTVLDNLTLFTELGSTKTQSETLRETALSLLEELGLKGYENAYPSQLSGGMRQRVTLARALLQRRPLLLLDEPFSSLDAIIREQLYRLLRRLRDKYQLTIVMITHDFRDALSLADRVTLLSEGKISEDWQIPKTLHESAEELGRMTQTLREALEKSLKPL
ncbi:MAG: aliphatic sulfonate ABC transporter ATP-binding protein [Waddliaceae bacterium]|nr:aliphatic sulfonate ABC transporter ATP-binding protein [Waddliaceae bacterium]